MYPDDRRSPCGRVPGRLVEVESERHLVALKIGRAAVGEPGWTPTDENTPSRYRSGAAPFGGGSAQPANSPASRMMASSGRPPGLQPPLHDHPAHLSPHLRAPEPITRTVARPEASPNRLREAAPGPARPRPDDGPPVSRRTRPLAVKADRDPTQRQATPPVPLHGPKSEPGAGAPGGAPRADRQLDRVRAGGAAQLLQRHRSRHRRVAGNARVEVVTAVVLGSQAVGVGRVSQCGMEVHHRIRDATRANPVVDPVARGDRLRRALQQGRIRSRCPWRASACPG